VIPLSIPIALVSALERAMAERARPEKRSTVQWAVRPVVVRHVCIPDEYLIANVALEVVRVIPPVQHMHGPPEHDIPALPTNPHRNRRFAVRTNVDPVHKFASVRVQLQSTLVAPEA
jgi:hypothetical protein